MHGRSSGIIRNASTKCATTTNAQASIPSVLEIRTDPNQQLALLRKTPSHEVATANIAKTTTNQIVEQKKQTMFRKSRYGIVNDKRLKVPERMRVSRPGSAIRSRPTSAVRNSRSRTTSQGKTHSPERMLHQQSIQDLKPEPFYNLNSCKSNRKLVKSVTSGKHLAVQNIIT